MYYYVGRFGGAGEFTHDIIVFLKDMNGGSTLQEKEALEFTKKDEAVELCRKLNAESDAFCWFVCSHL